MNVQQINGHDVLTAENSFTPNDLGWDINTVSSVVMDMLKKRQHERVSVLHLRTIKEHINTSLVLNRQNL